MGHGSLFSTRFTLGLAAFLVGVGLLARFTPYEPFPSTILPGAGKPTPVGDGVARFMSFGLWGRTPSGEEKRIVVSKFLDPIPDSYVYEMANSGFGLTPLKPTRVNLGPLHFNVPAPDRSKRARKIVSAWLKSRLRDEGLADEGFVVRRDHVEIDMATNRELDRRTTYEKAVHLH